MRTALVGFAAGLLGTVAVVVPYHYVSAQKPFGVVDINGIFNLRSLVLADKASTVKTPEARAALEAEAGNTGPKIDQALADVQKRCNCVLLVRAAVISNLPDYTDQVKHTLGLDGVDESALQAKITHNLVGKLSDMIAQPTPGVAPSGVDPKGVPAPGVK
ncbi:hypothetical protein [Burkholderia territorii]|uniref:hypothetical protein n=1 Tax=Burkholderia territorii TaxID=1503055 RepID=UPI000A5A5509|nr:hypothetical protein [Burkholderia territorii]